MHGLRTFSIIRKKKQRKKIVEWSFSGNLTCHVVVFILIHKITLLGPMVRINGDYTYDSLLI